MSLVENPLSRLWRFTPLAVRDTGLLIGIDGLTNLADYGFHVFMGRRLSPGDFAILQTINSLMLILLTSFAVMEPVVARYVAEATSGEAGSTGRLDRTHLPVLFRQYLRAGGLIGLVLACAFWFGRHQLGEWLGVPALAVGLVAIMPATGLLRPVVSGMFQGLSKFKLYGLTRSTYALSRLAIGVLLVGLGSGVYGAVSALPLGSALALSAGLLFLGGYLRASGTPLPKDLLGDTLRLSAGAFLAFGAYMILLNNDLLWVNRSSAPETAGIYASAVLLRRAFSLLPGAVIVILYPRMVASVVQRRLPDGLLLKAAAAILTAGILLSLVFFTSGERILELTFGPDYTAAGALLGWMGVGVIGYSLSAMWMNLYLATRPWPFVLLLVLAAGLQNAFLAQFHAETSQVILIFCVVGWFLALSGLVLYLAWLRPALVHK